MTAYELLLIGAGVGVGKTTVAWEVSSGLQEENTAHCMIEGDYMDQSLTGMVGPKGRGTGFPDAFDRTQG